MLIDTEGGTLIVSQLQEVNVPRPTGPTIARWQLGGELRRLREAAGISHAEIADVLGCSESKIYKIESGDVGVGRGDFLVMLGRYGIDEAHQESLLQLQKQGKERGWWAKYGQLPNPYAMYVGLESAATTVRNFELATVPGLLQTEDYARAAMSAVWPNEPDEVERRVRLRMDRQKCLTEDPPLQFWAILDEAVLRRQTGGREVMRKQLRHIVDVARRPNVTIQVLPFAEGWHPGTSGSFAILEFPEHVHSPVAYVVSQAGEAYLEREDDMKRVTLVYTHMHAAALSESKSRELIAAIARELA